MKYLCIFGSFRSGTTPLVKNLSKIKNIFAINELWYYSKDFCRIFKEILDKFPERKHLDRYKCLKNCLKNPDDFYNYFINLKKSEIFNDKNQLRKEVISYFQKNIKKSKKFELFIDKLPEYLFEFDYILEEFNPKFIMCLRDCRGVITAQVERYKFFVEKYGSKMEHWWTQPDINSCINMENSWIIFIKKWLEIKEKLNKDQYFEFYYDSIDNKDVINLGNFLELNKDEIDKLIKIFKKDWKSKKKFLPNIDKKLPKKWKELNNKILNKSL